MAARGARKLGLSVFAGHGLTYRNIDPIAMMGDIEELNIGHYIISRDARVGLEAAVRGMIALMRNPRRWRTSGGGRRASGVGRRASGVGRRASGVGRRVL